MKRARTNRSRLCLAFKLHRCLVLSLSPNVRRPSGPRDTGFTSHRTQRFLKQGAGMDASFCLFWPRATASVRGRRRAGRAATRPTPGSPALRPLSPAPGRKQSAASQSAGGTLRLPHWRRAPSQGGRLACSSVASAPPQPGAPSRPRWAQPLSRRPLGAAKHPGRTRSRRKVARACACARRRRGYKRERGRGRRKWAVRRRLVLLFGVWASGGAFLGGPPVQAVLTGPLAASL